MLLTIIKSGLSSAMLSVSRTIPESEENVS